MTPRAFALAPAKINIGLEVTGRRSDGFHDVVSILQTVSLYDRLELSACQGGYRYESPAGIDSADDLVRKAFDVAPDRSIWEGRLRLHKEIPVAAGLGGGSSDAALALKIAYPDVHRDALVHLSADLGSDVPFFLEGGTSLGTGIGTDLKRLPHLDAWCVIVTPRFVIPNKTRSLYASLTAEDCSDGGTVRHIADRLGTGGAIDTCPPNAFTRPLMKHPPIQAARDALRIAGAAWVSVSGAGPSLYTLVTEYRIAKSIADRVPPSVGKIFIARTLPRRHHHLAAENLARLLRGGQTSR